MATARLRDLEGLRSGLNRWLAQDEQYGSSPIDRVAHASAGWSNETVLVTLVDGKRLVVRLPALVASFPDDQLPVEATVLDELANSSVPVPAPITFVADEGWLGSSFLVMPFVGGHVPGQAPAFDPWVLEGSEASQRHLYEAFLSVLGAIHRVQWADGALASVLRGGDILADSLESELDWWERYVHWSFAGDPLTALVDALSWCRRHRPGTTTPPSLLWGDPRLGNLVMDDNRDILSVLDWEMASIGPAEMDLGWVLALEWSTAELTGRRVPGFPAHDEAVTRYEAGLGRSVADLEFYEIFALVRSLAISNHQARAARAAGVRYAMRPDHDNPMVELVGRRIAMV